MQQTYTHKHQQFIVITFKLLHLSKYCWNSNF